MQKHLVGKKMNKMKHQYKIILASNSPRRKELLAGLDIDFRVEVKPGIDESYPETLPSDEVPLYLDVYLQTDAEARTIAQRLVLKASTL